MRTAEQRAAKVAEAAAYGRTLGAAAAKYYQVVCAADAREVLALARRGELAEAARIEPITARITARELARDLAVRPGTRLAAEMHAAMGAAYGPALYEQAIEYAQAALGGDVYA